MFFLTRKRKLVLFVIFAVIVFFSAYIWWIAYPKTTYTLKPSDTNSQLVMSVGESVRLSCNPGYFLGGERGFEATNRDVLSLDVAGSIALPFTDLDRFIVYKAIKAGDS